MPRRRLPFFAVLIAAAASIVWSTSDARGVEYANRAAAMESIQADDLKMHVDVLADDSFEGRGVGTRGGRVAGKYLVEKLQKFGVAPAGVDGSYFQPTPRGGRNVLAMIPGSDPKLGREVVLVGAHYDHVGYGSDRNSFGPVGQIHNGADDNASGTAGLLELTEALVELRAAPRRTLLLAWWDAEETGLLGSKQWISEPTVPLDRVVAAINLDMIGRMKKETLRVYGTRTCSGFRSLIARGNSTANLSLDFRWEIDDNSDHYPFFESRIPFIMLHSGLHADYHRPSDDAHKINLEGMQKIVRLLFSATLELADRDEPIAFRANSQNERSESIRHEFERPLPPLPGRLGITWKTERQDDKPGLIVDSVRGGSAADRAGLQSGDRIVQFAGRKTTDAAQFLGEVLAAEKTAEVVFQRGDGDPIRARVDLEGEPVRLGIAWRADDADPAEMLIVRVVYGSPAYQAGMKPGDRVVRYAGKSPEGSDGFGRLVRSAPAPVDVELERRGRMLAVRIEGISPPPAPADNMSKDSD